MSDKSRPPKFTTSSGLFIMTLLFAGVVTFWYQHYYMRERPPVLKNNTDNTDNTIYVKAGENLEKILGNIEGPADVVLAAGVFSFEVSMYLQGKKDISIKGEKATVVKCNSGSVFVLDNCTNFRMENFTVQCDSSEHHAIRIMQGRKVSMKALCFQTSGYAVSVSKAPDDAKKKSQAVELLGCSIDGEIKISGSEQITIARNKIMTEIGQGPVLSVRDSSGIVLEKNEVKTYAGFYLVNVKQKNANRISRNNFTTTGYGLKMENCNKFSLESNHVKAEQSAVVLNNCIEIAIGGKQKASEARNVFKSTGGCALALSGCKQIDIIDMLLLNGPESTATTVHFEFCDRVDMLKSEIAGFAKGKDKDKLQVHGGGILIQKSRRVTIKHNQIYDGLNNGVQAENESSKIKILDNTIRQNMQEGIVVDSSQAVIKGNKIHNNHIGVQLIMPAKGTNIIGNQIFDNSSSGIAMEKAAPQIFGNEIKNNWNGIELNKSSPVLRNNRIINNQGVGILKDKLSDIATNQDNIISGNKMGEIK